MHFRLIPWSMTLDDLVLTCNNFEFSWNFTGFRRFGNQQRLNITRWTPPMAVEISKNENITAMAWIQQQIMRLLACTDANLMLTKNETQASCPHAGMPVPRRLGSTPLRSAPPGVVRTPLLLSFRRSICVSMSRRCRWFCLLVIRTIICRIVIKTRWGGNSAHISEAVVCSFCACSSEDEQVISLLQWSLTDCVHSFFTSSPSVCDYTRLHAAVSCRRLTDAASFRLAFSVFTNRILLSVSGT